MPLIIDPAKIMIPSTASLSTVVSAAPLSPGNIVRVPSDDNLAYLADKDTQDNNNAFGIVINYSSSGFHTAIVRSGDIEMGAILTPGETYVAWSGGGRAAHSELLTGDWTCILGVASTTSILKLGIQASGAQKP
jgi:hypothetical protein